MRRSLRSWLWRVPLTREVDDELAFHLDMRTRELVDQGIDADTARADRTRPSRRPGGASADAVSTKAGNEIATMRIRRGSKSSATM